MSAREILRTGSEQQWTLVASASGDQGTRVDLGSGSRGSLVAMVETTDHWDRFNRLSLPKISFVQEKELFDPCADIGITLLPGAEIEVEYKLSSGN